MSPRDLERALELKKQLTSATAAGTTDQLRTVLLRLRQDVVPTEELLKDTKLGLAVGGLRKNESKEIAEMAKEIVKKWRKDVESHRGNGIHPKPETKPSASLVDRTSASEPRSAGPAPLKADSPSTDRRPAAKPAASTAGAVADGDKRTGKTDGLDFEILLDKTRDKCLELIYDALVVESSAPSDSIFKRAREIEEGAYTGFGSQTNAEYKAKMRSLFLNLKDKKNPDLRAAIISGDVPAGKLWSLSPQELASQEQKARDQALKETNLFDSLGATGAKSETDMFQCGRCKQRKCTYYQMQTRSADEPMTTFVTCTVCDNRWKFC